MQTTSHESGQTWRRNHPKRRWELTSSSSSDDDDTEDDNAETLLQWIRQLRHWCILNLPKQPKMIPPSTNEKESDKYGDNRYSEYTSTIGKYNVNKEHELFIVRSILQMCLMYDHTMNNRTHGCIHGCPFLDFVSVEITVEKSTAENWIVGCSRRLKWIVCEVGDGRITRLGEEYLSLRWNRNFHLKMTWRVTSCQMGLWSAL